MVPALLKLSQTHVCVHIHLNNAGIEVFDPVSQRNLPDYLEITLLRKDLFTYGSTQSFNDLRFDPNFQNVPSARPLFLNDAWLTPIKGANKSFLYRLLCILFAEYSLKIRTFLSFNRSRLRHLF